ncbi:MAG: pyridoxal phosphate-dependent aminotransferase [Candidatus Bipolaricaulia bacterium]
MPRVSTRAGRVPPSPIRKLVPLADEAKRAGKKVYHLNIGQPDIPTPSEFLKGFRNAPKVLAYSPSPGFDEALGALVRYYRRFGIDLGKEQLIITVGGSEAVTFAMLIALDPGDEILIPEPFYGPYSGYAEIANVKVVPLTTRLEEGFRLPERREIEAKLTKRTRAILITNPGNPTGVVYTQEELELLGEIALERDLFLISDEVYREFVYDGLKHVSVLELPGLEEHAILVDSISKRFSACGARIGAIASRNKDVMAAAMRLAQTRLSPPTAGQLGLINYLNSPAYPRKTEEMIEEFRLRRDLLYELLSEIPGVRCTRPQGAFYIMARLPVTDAEGFTAWLLTDFERAGETVMLAPGEGFYKTPGLGKDEARIAYVLNREELRRALWLLGEALAEYAALEEVPSESKA